MEEIKIGIIGGCLASLNNVSKSDLFYMRIKNYFKDNYKLSFSLGSYNNFSEIEDEIIRLKGKKDIEYLILQIRPDVYLKNCKIYLKTSKGNFINPLLKNKKDYQNIENNEKRLNISIHERINSKVTNMKRTSLFKKYLSFYNLNLFFGYIFGIEKSLEKYYLNKIIQITDFCAENNIKLIIHGPVARISYKMELVLIENLSNNLQKELKNICTYIKTNEILYKNEKVLFEDEMHVNSNGHLMLSEKIAFALKSKL